ncbi:hypothetical protein QTV49_000360 [Vibrio vulnificus]|nr:hypothetical protein [Vibrio vulnificus]
MTVFKELKISARRSVSINRRRKASEDDYDCVFKRDEGTGLFYAYINSDYNINSPLPCILKHISGFNPENPDESLRFILKNIDTEMLSRGYISRCVCLIFKTEGKFYVAKVGGGVFLFAICPPLIDGLPVSVYPVANRSWESERDFFCGSGGAIPLVEQVDSDSSLVAMTHTLMTDLVAAYKMEVTEILEENFQNGVDNEGVNDFLNDIFEFIYKNNNTGAVDAYISLIC